MSAGLDQRRALEAAERALRLLAAGDGAGAARAARQAAGLDRTGAFRELPGAVAGAASALVAGGMTGNVRTSLEKAVGPGPLRALVEQLGEVPEDPTEGTKVPM